MTRIEDLRVKLFADGATLPEMAALATTPYIRGFTTNPSLMRKAGIRDYRQFAREALAVAAGRPISFEVCADDLPAIEAQGREIATWGACVYVKVPIMTTDGRSTAQAIRRLSAGGVHVNVTAVLTVDQVEEAAAALDGGAPGTVSLFAGRIADTGRDPMPIAADAVRRLAGVAGAELIWASSREMLNVFQADAVGCHIITVTTDLLRKVDLVGKDLREFSLDTVRMFRDDAMKGGYEV